MIIREILDSIKNIAIAVVVALIIVRYVGQTAIVNQYSMQNTLFQNDVLWVEKITSTFGTLRRGDVVTIYAPQVKNENFILVKRVTAVAGDFIEIKDGKVFVNGAALQEDYTKGTNTTTAPENPKFNAIKIPVGKVYCLGDNRSQAIIDSRDLGPIDLKDIRGRAIFRFWPFERIGSLVR